MKTWKMILVSTLVTLTIGCIYLFTVFKHRADPGVTAQKEPADTLSQDDLAVVRSFFPAHYEDLARLEGTSVWMRDGYAMPYFPYAGGKVDFAKRVGLLAADQKLDVKKIVKAATPAKVDDNIEHGSKQAFAVFALPGGTDLFAVPVGYMDGNQEAYYPDLLFYYDDPHTIYAHWPKDVWAAVDAHQVKPGMSELETQMAVGNKLHADGEKVGDRTVTYDQDGKQWKVTFVKNRATDVVTGAKSG